MSTRANIIINDNYDKLYFYRHSDGYPKGTVPTLRKFLNLIKQGKIRNNISQASGWLVILGAEEYKHNQITRLENVNSWDDLTEEEQKTWDNKISSYPKNWKVGAYEPTNNLHGDIEYLYTVNIETLEICISSVQCNHGSDTQHFTKLTNIKL